MEPRSSISARCRPRARRLVAVTALTVVGVASSAAAEIPSAPAGPWVRPVDGALVRPFVAPASRYGAGHRGADLAAAAGTPVRAAGAGVVSFAGSVAGSLHVVVAHDGGLRTSYSFLSQVDVRRGQRVARGEVVGRTGGVDVDHPPGTLHFGLRVADRYVDPMVLFSPPDLARVIRLVPVELPAQQGLDPPALEQRALAESLHLPRGVIDLAADDAGTWGAVRGVAGALVRGTRAVADPLARGLRLALGRTIAGQALGDLGRIRARLLAWAGSRLQCTSNTAAPPGGGGSGHRLLAVAGLDSESQPGTGATMGLDWSALGYRESEVGYFSYARDGGPYRRRDTWGDLVRQAVALRDQLRRMQAAQPGREVDLIAHSQGGVVVDAFLQLVYDPADPTLPPMGTVVTLSSPHLGAPLATVARRLRGTPAGRRVLAAIRAATSEAFPPPGSTAARQLADGSALLRDLWDARLPEQVDFTSVSGVDDVVVPADRTSVPGATEVTVDPEGLGDHSAILRDPKAMAAVRLALERRPPPCIDWVTGLRGAVEPVLITRVELTAGGLAKRAADVASPVVNPVVQSSPGQGGRR